MSSGYASRRLGQADDLSSNRKAFVPKLRNCIPKDVDRTKSSICTALSDPSSQLSCAASRSSSSTSCSRNHLLDDGAKASIGYRGGKFVNYLPHDEAVAVGLGANDGGLDALESQRVVDLLNRELSRLLKLKPREFWREVATDTSLHEFLDSFLKFRSRWYDFPSRGSRGIVAGIIVGEVDLSRRVFMLLYRTSSNKDPFARSTDSLNIREHTAFLQETKLLELNKLLDICAIYGRENQELTGHLVLNALSAQPGINDTSGSIVTQFIDIANAMSERCNSYLEALLSRQNHEENKSLEFCSYFLEVMDFINDAAVSMDAFVSAYNHAAMLFCSSYGRSGEEELLYTLAKWHDSILPTLYHGLQAIQAKTDIHDVNTNLMLLSSRLINFGWHLLEICYLSEDSMESSPCPSASKVFPSNVEDPLIRADIIIHALREITRASEDGQKKFLPVMARNHNLGSKLQSLQQTGWVLIDDEQLHYLSEITRLPLQPTRTPPNDDAAIIESRISQIRDIFPEYGKHFISSCLEAYGQNPEEVIQRILEGTLHDDLQLIDTSLENHVDSKKPDKGKAKVSELVDLPPSSSGRYTRKPKHDTADNRILDSSKDYVKTAILAAQYEYEDEYDDSFDDLGTSVEPGFGETDVSEEMEKGWKSEKRRPQFYVKDGKNYSYNVAGSIGVSDLREASLVKQAQKEQILGLGRGGNIMIGAIRELSGSGHGYDTQSDEGNVNVRGGRGNYRGRGRRGGGSNHYRKDRALRKHFSGVAGF